MSALKRAMFERASRENDTREEGYERCGGDQSMRVLMNRVKAAGARLCWSVSWRWP